ncbi:hypothetical protein IPJ72_04565 [Candidatus Peregrinibacteria bacterium]|nr:MAG: hypothetical protein IPJ72_04565 [Candidatus Peregrinibacteria bacterium]
MKQAGSFTKWAQSIVQKRSQIFWVWLELSFTIPLALSGLVAIGKILLGSSDVYFGSGLNFLGFTLMSVPVGMILWWIIPPGWVSLLGLVLSLMLKKRWPLILSILSSLVLGLCWPSLFTAIMGI